MQRTAKVDINLEAISHNLSVVRKHAGDANVLAVIKANAYGHGMISVAQHLQDKVEAMAVACVEEAVALRKADITTRLVILQGFHSVEQLRHCVQYSLEPVCHQSWQIELIVSNKAAIPVWLKLDTGMHRLGLSPSQTLSAFEQLSSIAEIKSICLLSHFANADQPEHVLNQQQLERFNQLEKELLNKGYEFESSLANSAAVLTMPAAKKQWVRPGVMLYGASPFADKSANSLSLQPAMSFETSVIAIRRVTAGEAIGYGSTWQADKDSLIAVIAAGYGDGYPRRVSPSTDVYLADKRCSIVGRVSMDMICVDITSVTSVVNVGDPVQCWGDKISVDEIAKSAATIGYELLCQAGKDQ